MVKDGAKFSNEEVNWIFLIKKINEKYVRMWHRTKGVGVPRIKARADVSHLIRHQIHSAVEVCGRIDKRISGEGEEVCKGTKIEYQK